MAVDSKQYLTELLAEAGVAADDPRRQVIFETLGSEKAAKRLGDDVLRQQDYSRNMDELRAKTTKAEQYYQGLLTTTAENQKVVNDYAAAVQRYEAEYGKLDGNGNGNGKPVITPVQGDFISKKDYDEQVKRMEGNFISIVKTTTKLQGQHWKEFNEPLPVDDLEKIAVDKNIPLMQAYDQMVATRREEMGKTRLEAQLKQAREEGVREFATKHKIPVDTGTPEFRPLLDRAAGQGGIDDYVPNSGRLSQSGESKLRAGFTETWDKAGAANTSG